MTAALKGPWSHNDIEDYLGKSDYPLRLACCASDGFPRIVSLWYLYREGNIYAVTHRDSKIAGILAANDKTGFEVSPNEPPYFGVRGQARASLSPLDDNPTLVNMLEHFLGDSNPELAKWLLGRSHEELLISLSPERFYSWDYRHRMADKKA